MTSFLLALQFLTVIPLRIKKADEERISGSMVYFPLIGLFIGLFLAGICIALYNLNLPSLSSGVLLVVILAFLTGGLHLDGLADSADAFLSRRDKEKTLEIMRDPHIGTMGVLSLISVILLKITFLSSLAIYLRIPALLLMCVLSRWSAVLGVFLFPYARIQGKARVFIDGMNLRTFMLSSIAAFIFAFFILGFKGLFILLVIAAFVYLSGRKIKGRIGGITGDVLGATIELSEVITLITVFIIARS